MHIIASKLNRTFGTIGNATADKMTAKVVEKLEPFALAWRIMNLTTRSWSEQGLRNVEQSFAFKYVSSPQLEWNLVVIELPFAFLLFGSLYLGILGFSSEQYKLARRISAYL